MKMDECNTGDKSGNLPLNQNKIWQSVNIPQDIQLQLTSYGLNPNIQLSEVMS